MFPAALGFRVHSGWAVAVALAAPGGRPAVAERRRIQLAGAETPSQPYHAAKGLPLREAEKLIGACRENARRMALEAVGQLVAGLHMNGHRVAGCGLLLAAGRPLPGLAAILASHALIHTAEGELFREALSHASDISGLPVRRVKERDLLERGVSELGIPSAELERTLAELGRAIGPPWRKDEKHAALAAWMCLASAADR